MTSFSTGWNNTNRYQGPLRRSLASCPRSIWYSQQQINRWAHSEVSTLNNTHPGFRYRKHKNSLSKMDETHDWTVHNFFPFFWVHFLQNKSSSLFFSRKKTVHGLQRANKRWTQTRDGLQRAKVNCKRLLYSWMNATIYTADRWNEASVILNQQATAEVLPRDTIHGCPAGRN